MKTPEQLKGAIRNIAKEKDLHAQEIMQIYMFERVLERLSSYIEDEMYAAHLSFNDVVQNVLEVGNYLSEQ